MAIAPPPELNYDLTAEILLRFPPDKPALLSRASIVSKLWHHIISDPGFLRRYHAFHGRAPLLRFIYNLDFPGPFSATGAGFDFPAPISRFIATTATSPPPHAVAAAHNDSRRLSWALDCRHGRVLFKKDGSMGLAVWDPIADNLMDLPPPGIQYASYAAVVLCDEAGCDDRDCHGGHFLVICIGLRYNAGATVYACVYSSEDGAWRAPVSDSTNCYSIDMMRPLIGDGIYCTDGRGCRILKYDFVKRRFASVYMPKIFQYASIYMYGREPVPVPMQTEDGSLGLAGVRGTRLYIMSTRWNNAEEGDAGWVQRKVIKLSKLLPLDMSNCIKANVIGFAEGVGVRFIRTNAGVFTLHLKSRQVTEVSDASKNYPTASCPSLAFSLQIVLLAEFPIPKSINHGEIFNIMLDVVRFY